LTLLEVASGIAGLLACSRKGTGQLVNEKGHRSSSFVFVMGG